MGSRLRVSPIGLGLAALGRPDYLNLCHGENLAERLTEADSRPLPPKVEEFANRQSVAPDARARGQPCPEPCPQLGKSDPSQPEPAPLT
jgi:hypothetical protein